MARLTVDQRNWHLEKFFSIGHMMTTASVAFYMIWWASAADTRLAQTQEAFKQYVESQVKIVDNLNNRLETIRIEADMKRAQVRTEIRDDISAVKSEIRDSLARIDNKVDRLLEMKMQETKK